MTEPPAGRLLTPAFVALTLSDLAYFTAGGLLIAATPLFVSGPLGGAEAAVGVTMGSFSVSTLLLRPLAGRWSDRYGRRSLLVGGAVAFALLALGHLVVQGLVGLVLLRVLLGAAEAVYFVAGFAALADLAPPGRAGEALSLNSLALYIGIATGPLLGQVLLDSWGFDVVWLSTFVLVAVAAALATRVPETKAEPTEEEAPPTPLVHPAALVPGLGLFASVAAMSGFLAFAVLHAQSLGIERWSGVLLLYGGTVVACRLAFARLPDRVGGVRLATAALAVTAVGLFGAGMWRDPAGLMVATVVLGVGVAFVTPAVFAAVFSVVPASERGSAAATTSVFIDLGLGGGPMLTGALAAASSIPTAFAWVAVLPLAGSLLLLTARRRPVPVVPTG